MSAATGSGPAVVRGVGRPAAAGRTFPVPERERGPAMRGAKAPTAAGALPWVGLVLALVVLGVAVVLLHDALLATGVIGGAAWLVSATTWVEGLAPSWWWVALGVVLIVIGVWLIGVALRRRRRTAYSVQAATGVHIGLRDVRRLVAGTAAQVAGVTRAEAVVTPRRVAVRVSVTGSEETVARAVAQAVEDRLGDLVPRPRCTVRTRPTESR